MASSSSNYNPNIGYRYPYDEDDGNDIDTDGKLKQSTNIKGECADADDMLYAPFTYIHND